MGVGRLLLLLAAVWSVGAQAARANDPATDGARTVEAEGAAPVIAGNVIAARQAAIQQALREAVENTFGVAVSARLDVRNHTVQEDHVSTRAHGYAVLERLLSEGQQGQTYRVRARVKVSPRPLAGYRAHSYRGQWRVLVALAPADEPDGTPGEEHPAAVELARQLQAAGLEMVAPREIAAGDWNATVARLASATADEVAAWGRQQRADIVVVGQVMVRAWRGTMLPADLLPIDYTHCLAQASARAIRTDTAEVIGGETLSGRGEGSARAQAVRACLGNVGRRLGRRLADALLQLPGARSRSVEVVIEGLPRISEAQGLEDMLAGIPIVRRLSRRSFRAGRLLLDLDVAADAAADLPVLLEGTFVLGGSQLRVESAQCGRITASVAAETPISPEPR